MPTNAPAELATIQSQAASNQLRLTQHAQQEMVAEAISLDDVLAAIANAAILEDYPDHPRGGCCLLSGADSRGRPIHIVCTTQQSVLIIITVYLPQPPKWVTPTKRRTR